jgi:hypothetical protein
MMIDAGIFIVVASGIAGGLIGMFLAIFICSFLNRSDPN